MRISLNLNAIFFTSRPRIKIRTGFLVPSRLVNHPIDPARMVFLTFRLPFLRKQDASSVRDTMFLSIDNSNEARDIKEGKDDGDW